MTFQFTHAVWLWAVVPALGWIIWLARKSDIRLSSRRWWASLLLRLVVALLLLLALAGLQSLIPVEGMNVFYVMDRSDSIPAPRQEAVLRLRYAIGTSVARTRQEVAILLSMNVSEIQRLEDQAAAIVWWNDFVPAGSDRVNH